MGMPDIEKGTRPLMYGRDISFLDFEERLMRKFHNWAFSAWKSVCKWLLGNLKAFISNDMHKSASWNFSCSPM